MSQSRRNSR